VERVPTFTDRFVARVRARKELVASTELRTLNSGGGAQNPMCMRTKLRNFWKFSGLNSRYIRR